MFQQTPDNSLVCPGQQLVFSCTTSSTGALRWQINGQAAVLFSKDSPANLTEAKEQFTFQLIGAVLNGTILHSTATDEMADSSLDGLEIECSDGGNHSTLFVNVAGLCACSLTTM